MRIRYAIILSLLLFISCNPYTVEEQLDISPKLIECENEGGTFEITISGPLDWFTNNSANWTSVNKKSGTAVVTIDKNNGPERTNTITFRSGIQRADLEINQKRSDIFTIDISEAEVSHKASELKIKVECYDSWTISTKAKWITSDIQQSTMPQEVTFSISRSEEKTQRTGTVEFECNGRTICLTITQAPGPYIALEKDQVEIDGDGGIVRILYISTTDVNITTDDSWIRLTDTDPTTRKVAFEVLRNLSGSRTGEIQITSASDNEYFKTLTIIQGEKIDHPAIRFKEGYEMEISSRESFTLTPIFEDMTDNTLTWSSDSPEIASVNQNGTVSIFDSGTCTITAKNSFHNISTNIKLLIKLVASDIKIMLDNQDMEKNPVAVRFPGEKLKVYAYVYPEDSYTEDIVCISSDPSTASVDGMTIICHNPGNTVISIESLYHNIRKSFNLIVIE